ncbi:cupin domain-containing protein [Marinobacterium sp. D7]|uniref:cupin domain-containing protein n=1 Tax=Marinobacterium ramblicola TaxID=2849041 RepID=UPI001C2D8C22|nr:cupin domain-containing protein [Marinobacterium ramblicola]MBV1790589.1 cupin domain-containing protein [Marinobacterium ramblicola]
MIKVCNLFNELPDASGAEVFEPLAGQEGVLIERIVSQGQRSPENGWYDQPNHEWVMLLEGAARLAFEDGSEVELAPGDALDIPAHTRHRVSWTVPDKPTVWLAVHYPAVDG